MILLQLPDLDFPINGKAEGRILIPWEHKEWPELSVQDTSGILLFTHHSSLILNKLLYLLPRVRWN